MLSEPLFSDIDPEFHVDHEGNLMVLEDEDAVNASLDNMFLTTPGERVMDPGWRCELTSFVGSSCTRSTAAFIRMSIERSLSEEPRVKLVDSAVEPNPDENEFLVRIQYTLNAKHIQALFEKVLAME